MIPYVLSCIAVGADETKRRGVDDESSGGEYGDDIIITQSDHHHSQRPSSTRMRQIPSSAVSLGLVGSSCGNADDDDDDDNVALFPFRERLTLHPPRNSFDHNILFNCLKYSLVLLVDSRPTLLLPEDLPPILCNNTQMILLNLTSSNQTMMTTTVLITGTIHTLHISYMYVVAV